MFDQGGCSEHCCIMEQAKEIKEMQQKNAYLVTSTPTRVFFREVRQS
jgi:hypothetical protein